MAMLGTLSFILICCTNGLEKESINVRRERREIKFHHHMSRFSKQNSAIVIYSIFMFLVNILLIK